MEEVIFPRNTLNSDRIPKVTGSKRSLNQDLLFAANKRAKPLDNSKPTRARKVTEPDVDDGFQISFGRLKPKDFTTNSLVLGVVLQVSARSAKLSLPGGNIGHLSSKHYSDVKIDDLRLDNFLVPNQIIRCSVIDIEQSSDSKPQISLSSKGSICHRGLSLKQLVKGLTIQGFVSSVEDHGYLISTGILSANFFLPRDSTESSDRKIGSIVNCVVHEVNIEARTVLLHCLRANQKPLKKTALTLAALLPGMVMSVALEKKDERGLVVSYLDMFRASIELKHVGKPFSSLEWQTASFDNSLVAKVLFVDRGSKTIKMSMARSILEGSFMDIPSLGSTVENVEIFSVNAHDILLRCPVNNYVYLLPENKADPEIAYKVGDSIPEIRVLGYQLADSTILCSNRNTYTGNSVIHASNLQVGQIHEVVISEIKDFGLIVKVNGVISALCPLQHVSDSVFSGKLNKHFHIGQSTKMRVWEIGKNGIIMTHKKSLVDGENDFLYNLDKIEIGGHYVGIVGAVSEDGIIVRFANKIKGEIPPNILTKQGLDDALETARPGQIVKVVLLEVQQAQQRSLTKVILAMDLNVNPSMIASLKALLPSKESSSDFSDVVSGTVVLLEDNLFKIKLDDGRVGVLQKSQIFDFPENNNYSFFKVGSRITNAVIIRENNGEIFLSLKPLIQFSKLHELKMKNEHREIQIRFPGRVSDLSPGMCVAGFISKVESFGVIIQLKNEITALVPRPSLCDRFMATPVGVFSVGSSVKCVIQRVDLNKERVFASFKSSLVPFIFGHSFLFHFLKESYLSAVQKVSPTKHFPRWNDFLIGQKYKVSLHSVEDYGLVFISDDQTTLFVDYKNKDLKIKIGKTCNVLVVDVDYENFVIEVELLESKNFKFSAFNFNSTEKFTCEIIRIKPKYLIVRNSSFLGYVSLADYNDPIPDNTGYNLGENIICILSKSVGEVSVPTFPHENVVYLEKASMKSSHDTETLAGLHVSDSNNVAAIYTNFKIGSVSKWIVESISELEMTLKSIYEHGAGRLRASIHVTECSNQTEFDDQLFSVLQQTSGRIEPDPVPRHHPFSKYELGKEIECTIIHLSHIKLNGEDELHLQLRPTSEKLLEPKVLTYGGKLQVEDGKVYTATVTEIGPVSCTVMLSPFVKAELLFSEVSSSFELTQLFKNRCFIGLKLLVGVLSQSDRNNKYHLVLSRTCIEKLFDKTRNFMDVKLPEQHQISYKEGDSIIGILDLRQHNLPNPPAFKVILSGEYVGRICITEIADSEKWMDLSDFFSQFNSNQSETPPLLPYKLQHGSVVRCRVTGVSGNSLNLSLRESRLKKRGSLSSDPLPNDGDLVKAYVVSVSSKGCFLRLSDSTVGRALLRDLSDAYIADPNVEFPTGKLVIARVLKVDYVKGFVQLSLKSSQLRADVSNPLSAFAVDQIVNGTVRRVTDFGVFVELQNSTIVGLARKAFCFETSNSSQKLDSVFQLGDIVKARILSISPETGKMALDLRQSTFSDQRLPLQTSDETDETDERKSDSVLLGDNNNGDQDEYEELNELPNSNTESTRELFGNAQGVRNKRARSNNNGVLLQTEDEIPQLPWNSSSKTGFFQDIVDDLNLGLDGDNDDTNQIGREKSHGKVSERELRLRELALAEDRLVPENSDDFERLIVANPNSSFVWIQYIAFYVNSADIDSARIIGNRALKTIHFREEEEKFNVWVAMLNLEYKYGSKESLETLFLQALKETKGKQLYLTLGNIYEKDGDILSARRVFEKALKSPQFRKSKKVWIQYHRLLIKSGDAKAAKEQLTRSLQSLSSHKHLEVALRFAISEFEVGSVDRGRVLFEELITSYPKKTDIWNIYVDKEIKVGNLEAARHLFQRMITLKVSSKVMKSIFKKYLAFETQYGNEMSQDAVKQQAKVFVASNN